MDIGIRATGTVTTDSDGVKNISNLNIQSYDKIASYEDCVKSLHEQQQIVGDRLFPAFVPNDKVYVLYHASCLDGSGARYAAEKRFGEDATYCPVQYGRAMPKIEDNSIVYILDFSYSKAILEKLKSRVKELVVLDHHKTAQEDLKDLPYAVFDMDKSGAVLAWEYFHPGVPVPKLLQMVQDRDLWKFTLEDTRAVAAGFTRRQKIFADWDRACSDSTIGRYFLDTIKKEGMAILEYEADLVKSAVGHTVVIDYYGYKVGMVNATAVISDIGHGIYTDPALKVDYSISFFVDTIGKHVVLSFRSKGDMDVGAIAKGLKGGGHKNASGARVSLKYLEKMMNNKFAGGSWSLRWETIKEKISAFCKEVWNA